MILTKSIIGVYIVPVFTILSLLLSCILLISIQNQNAAAVFGRLKPLTIVPISLLPSSSSPSACIVYNKNQNSITINCHSARLIDVYNQFHNPSILAKEQQQPNKNNNSPRREYVVIKC